MTGHMSVICGNGLHFFAACTFRITEEARHYTGQFDMGKNGYSETCPLSANPSLGTNPTFQNHSIDIPSKFRDFLSQH